ncbi:MAG: BrnA antitoxin family protein [Magnetococcus sp. YQC-3]
MSKRGLSLEMPTSEEDAMIAAGIACDPDTYEPSEEEIIGMQPLRRGRPATGTNEILLSVRYSPEVVAFFRATGSGWQTRMDEALREWITARASSH